MADTRGSSRKSNNGSSLKKVEYHGVNRGAAIHGSIDGSWAVIQTIIETNRQKRTILIRALICPGDLDTAKGAS